MRRTGPTDVHHYAEIYEFLQPGDLLKEGDDLPKHYRRAVESASPHSFEHVMDVAI